MARKKRMICPGYCYHVMMRGVGGQNIFEDDRDRARFSLLLQYASETCNFTIHGFCFMGNHVHLLLQPHTADLASGMHRLAFRYAQYFNKKSNRQGYLFQGRYKAIIVQNGMYMRCLIRYIHRNPVRANLVKDLSVYQWSSHQAYVGHSEFVWLKTDLVMPLFGSEADMAREAFQKYVYSDDADVQNELQAIRKSMEFGAYGNKLFVETFRKAGESDATAVAFGNVSAKISLEMVVNAIERTTAVTLEEIRSSSRRAQVVDARAVLIYFVQKFKMLGVSELAHLLYRDPTSIARLAVRVEQDRALCALTDSITAAVFAELHETVCLDKSGMGVLEDATFDGSSSGREDLPDFVGVNAGSDG